MLRTIWNNNINVNADNFYLVTTPNMLRAVKRAQTQRFVHIGAHTYLDAFLTRENICDVTLAKHTFFKTNLAFPVTKGFPYLAMFNQR